MRTILFPVFVFFSLQISAQVTDYWQVLSTGETLQTVHMFRGDSLYKLGKLQPAIAEYRIQNSQKYSICKYQIACAFAKNLQYDSAFYYLHANMQYDFVSNPASDPTFLWMMDDPRWDVLVNRWIDSVNHRTPGAIQDIPLAKLLWKMYARDQAYYYEIQLIDPTMQDSSALSRSFWQMKYNLNATNSQLLDSIITNKGWPKISQVGKEASSAAFMVVQHMDFTMQEKYLPLIKLSCEQKESEWSDYAHVYDRVCFSHGRPQLYGTQLEFDKSTGQLKFYPIEDETNVNKRRAALGMGTLEDYAAMVGFMYSSPVKSK